MTAEIAILNKKAVALASDSAVTISSKNIAPKIYTSVNKLFQLTKYHPVGIMIFGSAEFMEYPWEVIIKEFRKKLNDKSFPTIKGYSNSFLSFIENNELFSTECQNRAVFTRSISFAKHILLESEKEIKDILEKQNSISESEILTIIRKEIDLNLDLLTRKKFMINFSSKDVATIKTLYKKVFRDVIQKVFEKIPLSQSDKNKITQVLALLFTKEVFPNSYSGIVISGFGSRQVFPEIVEYNFDLVVNEKPKYRLREEAKISFKRTAIISPFAQSEMVRLFVEGIDPNYNDFINHYIEQILTRMPDELVSIIPKIGMSEKKVLSDKMKKANKLLLEDIKRLNKEYRNEHHIHPLLETVDSLPQIELAEMAEALVSLTSFKRKMSLESETVGGPIDVALITKGDGFVWIKRKHYFRPELNHHFFDNYYKQ